MQPRQRVGLEKIHITVRVASYIDAPGIATAEASPGRKRQFRGRKTAGIRYQTSLDPFIEVFFVFIGVYPGLRSRPQLQFHDAEHHRGRSCAKYTHGEFAARQVTLHQDRLAVTRQQPLASKH